MRKLVTIGAYGWTPDAFFRALVEAGVDTFVDVRARRGVRGAEYSFANSQRLQGRLAELGIRYVHRKDLAPSNASRAEQYAVDSAAHTGKRRRTEISSGFAQAYQRERLATFDSAAFAADLGAGAQVVALFCVEGLPAACHRALLAERLAHDLGAGVSHVTPS